MKRGKKEEEKESGEQEGIEERPATVGGSYGRREELAGGGSSYGYA
jgi:hypothetical protein